MKSSFMLYTLCMKISDPESRCYCVERSEEDPRSSTDAARELTFFMDTDSGGTLAETAPRAPCYTAYIVLSSPGETEVSRKKADDDVSYAGSANAEREREKKRCIPPRDLSCWFAMTRTRILKYCRMENAGVFMGSGGKRGCDYRVG